MNQQLARIKHRPPVRKSVVGHPARWFAFCTLDCLSSPTSLCCRLRRPGLVDGYRRALLCLVIAAKGGSVHASPTLDKPVLDVSVCTQDVKWPDEGGARPAKAIGEHWDRQHWPITIPIRHIHCTWQNVRVGRRVVNNVVDILQLTDKC